MNVVSFTLTTAGNITFNMNSSAAINAADVLAIAAYLTKIAPTFAPPVAAATTAAPAATTATKTA